MRPFVNDLLAQSTRLLAAKVPEEVLALTCHEIRRVAAVDVVFGSVAASATWTTGVHQRYRGVERIGVGAAQRSALFAVHRALSRQRGPVRLAREAEPTIVGALCAADSAAGDILAFPIVHAGGRVSGCLGLCLAGALNDDVTGFVGEVAALAALALDNVQRMASARRDRERLRLLAEAAEEALWDWSPDSGEFWWGGGVHTLLGDVVVQSRLSWKFEQVHSDDRARVRQSFEDAVSDVDVETWRQEYRQRRTDGSWIQVEDHAHILRDSEGRAHRVVGALRDVTELRALIAGEHAARAEAERASLAKDEFLAMLGHELRNPLSPIVSAVQLLRKTDDPATAARGLAIIERQARHLTRLVDDLLDVARIAQGKVLLERDRFDLADAVDDALETANPLIESREHAVERHIARGLMVDADRARMAQAIGNLMTNAAKYTAPGGRITVEAVRLDHHIQVRITDSGVGIAPDMLSRVFHIFVQGDQSLDRTRGGLGLGLAIVRNLVQLHGGTVNVTSEGEGRGATFTLTLPAATSTVADVVQVTPFDVVSERPRRVLVVDDNVDAAESLADELAQIGHQTRVAHDGHAALIAVADHSPEVVLLDLGLPLVDGYEVARRICERLGAQRPRLIAVTGYGQDSDRRRTRDAGFDLHLVKPVPFQALREAVRAPVAALPARTRANERS